MSQAIDYLRALTPAPLRGAVRRFRLDRAFMRGRLDQKEFDALPQPLQNAVLEYIRGMMQ